MQQGGAHGSQARTVESQAQAKAESREKGDAEARSSSSSTTHTENEGNGRKGGTQKSFGEKKRNRKKRQENTK